VRVASVTLVIRIRRVGMSDQNNYGPAIDAGP